MPALSDVILAANVIIAVLVAYGEYKRRKAQNKESEGNSVNAIANAAAKVSESSVGLLTSKDSYIRELKAENNILETRIECYKSILKEHNIPDTICEE